MKKSLIINKFKTAKNVASFLKISIPAVSKWGEIIPEKHARKLAMDFPRQFKFDEQLYTKRRH